MVALRPKLIMSAGAALTAALAVAATPAGGATKPGHLGAQASASATAKAPSGNVFGGVTPQSWPVVVALSRARDRVEQVVIGLDMACSSGDTFGTSDGFQALKLSKTGRFSMTVGPTRIDAGGVPADVESKVIGRMAKGRASIRGVWSLKITIYDPAGSMVVDTCESGLVSWTAVQ
ncbi:hypothetical protein BH20ACT16_BH20ACT16_04960 [soil metagenome]